MLADYLIEAADVMPTLLPVQRQCYAALADLVRDTPKYVLDRSAVHFIQSTSQMSPDRFLTALSICRMPFPRMWVEFAFRDRTDWINETGNTKRLVNNDNASAPSRLGFYLEQKDDKGQVIEVTPVWVHTHDIEGKPFAIPETSICSLSQLINTGTLDKIDPIELAETRQSIMHQLTDPEKSSLGDPARQKAWMELAERVTQTIPSFMEDFWLWIDRYDRGFFQSLKDSAEFDLLAEWKFILALLLILNSRNLIKITDEISYDKLNKNRVKKNKPPLLSHRDIKLNFSRVQRNRMGGISGTINGEEKVNVGGHWKVRNTGLFFWHDYKRRIAGVARELVRRVRA